MKSDPDSSRDEMVIKILRLLSEIKKLPVHPNIPTTANKFLMDVCRSIGFESFTSSLLPDVALSLDSCAFKPIKLVSKMVSLYPFMSITVSPIEWQLEHFGEYMDRSMDSAPDARVPFSPDRWQREVLDAIDKNESLLALAPTSAGKTFISFYAMERILRESDDGVLVYIAPTKALVNQIAAEVYGRFSKHYSGNQTLLAVHTRDTRTGDLQRAQILITVPEMLGILILSPALAQNWTSRVKRRNSFHRARTRRCGLGTNHSARSVSDNWVISDGRGLLCQKDILEYEKVLKDVVVHLMVHDPNSMKKIISSLTPRTLTDPGADVSPSKDEFLEGLMSLVCDLHKLDNLPAILFSFDRTSCEYMAKSIVKELESSEAKWKQSSHRWKTKLAEVENWRKLEKVRSAQRQKEMRQKQEHDAPRDDVSSTHAWQATFHEEDPLADFSFAGRPSSKEELEDTIRDLSGPWLNTPDWAINALRRGIAVHHAGMSKAYRVVIENLFRQGFIRVMISTGTLALGINAPARTSVFCDISCSASVPTVCWPCWPARRLVLSRLPALGDSFPLTSTFILRLFNLLQGSNYADFAVRSVESVMNLPRISHRSDMGKDQVLHHVRFSIEYLRRAGLLNHEGKPTNLFGISSHLYHTEPSNFALVYIFESGIIHKICEQSSSVNAEMDLLLLLCHLFGRRYIPRNYSQPEVIARLMTKYPSQIILPPLPSEIADKLQGHNNDILRMFSSYALSYAVEHQSSLGVDDTLPLNGPTANTVRIESPFIDYLDSTKITPIARSIFAATSGLDDHFTSIYDLVSTVRKGIHLHEHAIPSMQGFVDHSALHESMQPEHKLNAYILDFYSHGQVSALAEANGIRRGDVWYELQEFDLTLKTIRTSLQELLIQLSLARCREIKDVNELLDLEAEEEDEENEEEDGIEGFKRPPKTSPGDWKVYEIFDRITRNFGEKFHEIFA
ncbi:P-loop containing nucleoside triphosphate hydrolase protein [Lentinula edodes]|uniref:p-loop containing nucleoside triphosphate hydrolase protein n=1 Tax=Lentinula edodes TaxID=5353 RepID=A0A1Q3ELH3_LENED|nr:P-loop containing nucleoside triphosphate hydrolase protein [Lentinula edodes]